MNFSVF